MGPLETVTMKLWVASGLTPLEAATVTELAPAWPAVGVHEITPVVASIVIPAGATLRVYVGAGLPVAFTSQLYATPTVAVVTGVEVIAGSVCETLATKAS
jgi:hypothetical protein